MSVERKIKKNKRGILLTALCIWIWFFTLCILSFTVFSTTEEGYAKFLTDILPFTKKLVMILNFSQIYMWLTVVFSIIAAFGAFLMWKLLRIGFYIFVASQAGAIIVPFIVLRNIFSNKMIFNNQSTPIIIAAALCVLFALNLNRMKRDAFSKYLLTNIKSGFNRIFSKGKK
ncbi:MAG: hypothetical protein KKD31_07115 [Bacteroidetes bacterium]|nr:hypothetical protein [Bacteroidota bacterium]